jgi:hypothetical protein
MDSIANNHALHGALAGVAVYALTKKPMPALVVGGGAYLYMSQYGHGLPGGAPPNSPAMIPSTDNPVVPVIPVAPVPARTSDQGYGWNTAPAGWTGTIEEWRETAHLSPPSSAYD